MTSPADAPAEPSTHRLSGAWKWIPFGAGSQCAEPVVDPVGIALVVPPALGGCP
ncbi:MAG TPA: hypothetical protein VFY38_03110 [Pseudonocardia sp.]|nr:hypothetical protein [Pseudonocardia sp.]